MFTIYNEILNPSKDRMKVVITSSISSGFLVYLTIATTGYLTFGNKIDPNILNTCTRRSPLPCCPVLMSCADPSPGSRVVLVSVLVPVLVLCADDNPDDISVLIARLMVTLLVIFSYPLQSHPARICLDNIYRVRGP